MLNNLNQYKKISGKIHTSAQPTVEEFVMIKDAGIKIVINLATADSPSAIINEKQIVQKNNMTYIHIPVIFEKPELTNINCFFKAMEQHDDKTIFVHCAYNWRVACFIYLYRIIKLNCDNETAEKDMLVIWQPNETWTSFIELCLSKKDTLK